MLVEGCICNFLNVRLMKLVFCVFSVWCTGSRIGSPNLKNSHKLNSKNVIIQTGIARD